jgi:hypothetical protein
MTNRPDLNSITPASRRQRLVNLMRQYITHDVVQEHIIHFDDIHSGEIFFTWHKDYIENMEKFLLNNNGKEFVPLPYYAGVEKVPEEFMIANLDLIPADALPEDRLPPQNRGPFPPFRMLPEWQPPRLCQNDSIEDISFQLAMSWHNNTIHNRIGGVLRRGYSPAAPIFWCIHAFLVDLYTTWKECRDQPRP